MFDFSNARLEKVIVHRVGNASEQEGIHTSRHPLQLPDEAAVLLMHYFLSPFKSELLYHLQHEAETHPNEIIAPLSAIFDDVDANFVRESSQLAKQLYLHSHHPKVKGGEFYVVFLRDCIIDDEVADAIGLFKSETKETFLKIFQQEDDLQIGFEDGISINRLDKGCLIFNTEADRGYLVTIVDAINKKQEAAYWKDGFLQVKTRTDKYYQTGQLMEMAVEVVKEAAGEGLEKPQQIAMVNRAVKYMKQNDAFEEDDFVEEVFHEQPDLVDKFKARKKQFESEHKDVKLDRFEISPKAIAPAQKKMKRVIKLDNNFSIVIHGNGEGIEKGETGGRNYYRLWFDQEK
jgi:hypothetical protein